MSIVPMHLTWTRTHREQVDDRVVEHHDRISEREAKSELALLNTVIGDYDPSELLSVEVVITHRTGYTSVTGFVPPKQ